MTRIRTASDARRINDRHYQELGDQLGFIITLSGMPVAELARRIGVTRASLNRWIAGQAVPRADYLAKLLHVLDARDGVWLSTMRCLVDAEGR